MFREELAAVSPHRKFWLLLGALALGFLLVAQAEAASRQETWVLQQVAEGKEADLKKQFGDKDEDRTLSVHFLEDLLTGAYKVHRKGVMITNAVIAEPLDLTLAHVPYTVVFFDCWFEGILLCRDAVFDQHLNISSSHFEKAANFQGLKVKLTFFCKDAIFQGPVDFTTANIKGQFIAKGAQFQGSGDDNPADFNGLKVGQSAFFDKAIFKGPVDFRAADIGLGFQAIGAKFIEHPVKFRGMKVNHTTILDQSEFSGPVDFSYSTFQALRIIGLITPNQKDALILEGLIYKSITSGDKPKDWKKLLALVDQARYNAQPYSQLETFLDESGYPDRANEVFIAKKRREMKETWHCLDYWYWPFEKVLFDWGVGYGRHPLRAFGESLFFIFLGTLIFSRPGVLSRKGKEPENKIKMRQAFWFSFDAFLPFIKLGPDKLYEVERDRRLSLSSFLPHLTISAQYYFYLHQLAGYVLVTIAVAAVTGIIK